MCRTGCCTGRSGKNVSNSRPDELGAVERTHHRVVDEAEPLARGCAHHQAAAADVDLLVTQRRMHGGGNVRGQRPRCGRPQHELASGAVLQWRGDVQREVLGLDVGAEHLVLRQAGAATRAPRQRHVTLVQVGALEALLEEQPDRFDVVVRVREVGVVPVHPLPEARRLLGDHLRVLVDPFAARPREVLDAERLDVGLALEAERPLDLDLDPESLAVEAVLVAAALALHRMEADDGVLQRPPPRVVHAHGVVRGDRPIEEPELGRAGPERAQAGERARVLPVLEHPRLDLEGVVVRVDRGLLGRAGRPEKASRRSGVR